VIDGYVGTLIGGSVGTLIDGGGDRNRVQAIALAVLGVS